MSVQELVRKIQSGGRIGRDEAAHERVRHGRGAWRGHRRTGGGGGTGARGVRADFGGRCRGISVTVEPIGERPRVWGPVHRWPYWTRTLRQRQAAING